MLIERARSVAFFMLAGALIAAPFSNSLFEIFSGIYLLSGLMVFFYGKRWDVLKGTLALLAAVYLAAVVLSFFQSAYWDNSLKGVFRALRCVLMCFLAPVVVDSPRKFKTIFYILSITAALIGLDALWQGFSGNDLIRGRGMTPYSGASKRVTGPFNHANDFSAYLSLAIFFFAGMMAPLFKKKQWGQGVFFTAGSALLSACLLWTYARGAWVAVAISMVLMALLKKSRFLFLVLAGGLMIALLTSTPALKARIASFWDTHDGTMTERRLLWDESFRMIGQKPWFGQGVNTYSRVEPQFKSSAVHTDYQYAHNGYLQIAAETGLVGLTTFLLFLLYFFFFTARGLWGPTFDFVPSAASSILFGITAFLIHSATDTDLQSLRLVSLLWLSLGLVLAAQKMTGLAKA